MHSKFAGSILVAITVTAMTTGCSSGTDTAVKTVTQTSTVTTHAAASATPNPTDGPSIQSSATAEPEPASWVMPNLIGRNLQAAQDAIQDLTDHRIFYTSSTDLTGKGRNQVLDRNWQVCSSTPPAGETITTTSRIDFGVVRIDVETCP